MTTVAPKAGAPMKKALSTPFGRSVAAGGAAAVSAGLALGNFFYLLMGGFLLASLLVTRPERGVSVTRHLDAGDVRAGDEVHVDRRVRADVPVVVHDALPDGFDVADGESNLRVVHDVDGDASYTLIPHARGEHVLPGTTARVLDPLGASGPVLAASGAEAKVRVEPKAARLGRVRSPRTFGRSLYAEGDKAFRGPKGNEFRELRDYVPGDPLKIVNWRATARVSRGDELNLVVNEYEPEGKKAVWLFLDTGPDTARGTTARTLLDVLVEGVLAAADHFLSRGHRVGLATYGGDLHILYPESGVSQYKRLLTTLTGVMPAPRPDEDEPRTTNGDTAESPQPSAADLAGAVEASRGFLVREKPFLVVFSSLHGRGLEEGIARAQVYASTGRAPAPALLVHTTFARREGPDAVVDRLTDARASARAQKLTGTGVQVLRWNPDEAPLAAILGARVA